MILDFLQANTNLLACLLADARTKTRLLEIQDKLAKNFTAKLLGSKKTSNCILK